MPETETPKEEFVRIGERDYKILYWFEFFGLLQGPAFSEEHDLPTDLYYVYNINTQVIEWAGMDFLQAAAVVKAKEENFPQALGALDGLKDGGPRIKLPDKRLLVPK